MEIAWQRRRPNRFLEEPDRGGFFAFVQRGERPACTCPARPVGSAYTR